MRNNVLTIAEQIDHIQEADEFCSLSDIAEEMGGNVTLASLMNEMFANAPLGQETIIIQDC